MALDSEDNPLAVVGGAPISPSWLLAPNALSGGGISSVPTPETTQGQNPPGVDPRAGVVHPQVAQVTNPVVGAMANKLGGVAPTPSSTPSIGGPTSLIEQLESGGRDVPQEIKDINSEKGTPAQGYLQIIDPTWKRYAPAVGIDTGIFPTALGAPKWVQERVASAIPLNQWGPNTVKALQAQFPGIDLNSTLGEAEAQFGKGELKKSAGGKNSSPGANSQVGSGTSGPSGLLRLALLQAAFPQHQFVPVQYDPFKIEQAEHLGGQS